MKYTIIKEISSGSFGIVYEVLVEHEEDGMTISTSKCVLKELTKIDTLSKERFEREVKVLSEGTSSQHCQYPVLERRRRCPKVYALLYHGVSAWWVIKRIHG